MKALLLRVGIDKGTDGVLAPIFDDRSFEYIPISEKDQDSAEERTYSNTVGRSGKFLAEYLPKKISEKNIHFDPEFDTMTYGDPTRKRSFLLKLEKNDLLVFYAGLSPFRTDKHQEGLYIIGYFVVKRIIDFKGMSNKARQENYKLYWNNAHCKRSYHAENLVIIVGDKENSLLLEKAIAISSLKKDKLGRPYHAVSSKIEELLGISGSIQRSIPPRFITKRTCLENFNKLIKRI